MLAGRKTTLVAYAGRGEGGNGGWMGVNMKQKQTTTAHEAMLCWLFVETFETRARKLLKVAR